jgi:DNA repair photolyase
VNLTITTVNSKLLRKLEPYSPPNQKRLETMKTLTTTGIPVNLYLNPYFPYLSENLLNYYIKKANDCGARSCAAAPLKIRPIIWKSVEQFLQTNIPSLAAKYEELYFKHGGKDLSEYWLPELTYRRKLLESLAEKCKELGMCFTAEEFLDLWTTPYSDCINVNSWHAPTAYDTVKFIKSNPTNTSLEEVIDHIKKNFATDKNWEKLMREYWDKVKLFT